MATIHYLPSTYRETFMHLAWSYPLLKIPTIADPAYVSDVMCVLCFIQVTKPIISCWIVRFQVDQTNSIVVFAFFMFILNISVEQTKFECDGGSISNRNLTITLSVYIYDSGQCKVIHTSSDLHVFWHPRNSKSYMYTDSRLYKDIFGVFYRKSNVATLSQKEFWSFYRFLRYPQCQIMTSFMGYLASSNVANSQASCQNELKFSSTILILLFNNNTYLKAHSFTFYLLYKRQFSLTNLTNYSCAGFVSPWW